MNKAPVPPWKTLLKRKTDEHFALFHSNERNFTRRGFLTSATAAAGLVVASDFALAPRARAADNDGPNPIPGGGMLAGVAIHHNPLPAVSSTPLTQINDPSEIGDFNGKIIDTQIRGLGTGTGLAAPVSFRADMGAMQGVYVGEDGKHHNGSFVFIWLDIYASGTVGVANPLIQIHDYSPGIAANGLFWVIPTDKDSMEIHFGAGEASLRMRDVPVMDAHDLYNNLTNGHPPPGIPIAPFTPVPATVSFDIEWSGITDRQKVVNVIQGFRGQFVKTGATIDWSAVTPSLDFVFQSESPNPARNLYAVIGHEHNGVFFRLEADDE